ncbi:Uncharacterized protein dnl_49860 [Desulfonema limicola]|uniref:Transposase n=1 Tax=Desulfonema limicola TaxID=45656 RepID=A0A975BC48_9BACT|nr:Uncharacterized protein dnl_49860 [Desulfonema limicola]
MFRRYQSVQAAYSSQEIFKCLFCGHNENEDVNASRVIEGRSGDMRFPALLISAN